MANTKKNVQEEKINAVEKKAEVKTEAASVPTVKTESVPASKSETQVKSEKNSDAKKETSKTEKKRGRKPASKNEKTDAKAEKASAAKSGKTTQTSKPVAESAPVVATKEKEPAAKNDDVPKTEKKRGRKPAAKSEVKAQTKTVNKRSTKKAEEKAPAKRGRKKSLTYDAVVEAARKKAVEADISRIKYPIAVNFELKGSDAASGIFYIVVSDNKVTVEPYKYNDYDVYIEADAAEFMNVLNGKKNIYDALADGTVTFGNCNLKKTILFINAVL